MSKSFAERSVFFFPREFVCCCPVKIHQNSDRTSQSDAAHGATLGQGGADHVGLQKARWK